MAEKDGVGWVEFCFATQNKMQPIKEAKKSKIRKESSPFFDGLQGAFAFAKTPFHPSYTSCTMLYYSSIALADCPRPWHFVTPSMRLEETALSIKADSRKAFKRCGGCCA